MFKKYSFFGFPKTSYKNVTRDTIAIVGSKCVSKSIHPTYGQSGTTTILRRLSREYDTHNLYIDQEIEYYDIVDLGDFGPRKLPYIIYQVLERGSKLIVVGGDHTTTYYSLRNTNIGSLTILDAHLDADIFEYHFHHGCVTRRLLLEKPNLDIKIVGFRGYSTMKHELTFLKEKAVEIHRWPMGYDTLSEIIEKTEALSLDLDFFDPSSFWAVRVPEAMGADFSRFLYTINRLEHSNMKYLDIVEYAPEIDPGYVCGKRIIQMLLEFIALLLRSH